MVSFAETLTHIRPISPRPKLEICSDKVAETYLKNTYDCKEFNIDKDLEMVRFKGTNILIDTSGILRPRIIGMNKDKELLVLGTLEWGKAYDLYGNKLIFSELEEIFDAEVIRNELSPREIILNRIRQIHPVIYSWFCLCEDCAKGEIHLPTERPDWRKTRSGNWIKN